MDAQSTREQIKDYYGKTLQTTRDLKTGACCSQDSMPAHVREVLPLIDREITEKFYGCGSPIPSELAGRTVLDLGCGTGRDVYLVSHLVGSGGRVIGVDMTEPSLAIARGHIESQMKRFGFCEPNVEFHQGYIEDLQGIGIADDSVDVVISNCVINLSPQKRSVFSEIFRILKPGGELYFSDIFADRRVPSEFATDPVLRGECLSGVLYVEDFRRMMCDVGFLDHRVTDARTFALEDPEIDAKIGMIAFRSMTIRAFKLDSLEDRCEDYGQVAIYRGTMSESAHAFELDDHHTFPVGKPILVCGNTAAMLEETRYSKHFTILGDRCVHYGSFDCSGSKAGASAESNPDTCC